MNKKEFSKIRHDLGKSQIEMSRIMGVSCKTIQSFEQGWRNIPVHVERQILFLLSLKQNTYSKLEPCWIIRKCPDEIRMKCPTWEFKAENLCWFINGTFCEGIIQKSWKKKISICRKCEVFQSSLTL